MNGKSVAISFTLLLALVDFGSCLKCYHCDSQKDPKCAVSLTSNASSLDCASQDSEKYLQLNLMNTLPSEIFAGRVGDPKYCHKILLQTGTVIRTCLDGKKGESKDVTCKTIIEESKNASPGNKVLSCFVCDGDNCNGAGAISFSLPLTLVAFVVSYLIYKQ